MKKLICIISSFFVLMSCSKQRDCCFINDLVFYVSVISTNGDDLLDPLNSQGYKVEDITLFYKKGQTFVKVYNPLMDDPKNIHLMKDQQSGRYKLRVYLNSETYKIPLSTTLIQFGDRDPDKIVAEIIKKKTSIYIGKVWINEHSVDKNKVYEFVK